MEKIEIRNAKVHNLKGIDVDIPRNALTVITGPSGSGKSSLAFDTIYAEGQRRYIDSLSSYARQFLGQIEPPDVESIKGLSPAIAIDQKSSSRNPRSTVGTVTEIYDYLRILYARVSDPYCPDTGKKLSAQSAEKIVETLLAKNEKTKLIIMAPIVRDQKGEHKELLSKFQAMGFSKIRLNKTILELDDSIKIEKNKKNSIDVVIDRIVLKEGISSRLTDSVEQALKIGEGFLYVLSDDVEEFYSEHYYSLETGLSYPELEPKLFSFNSPLGACPECNGLGIAKHFDRNLYIEDPDLSISEGAILPLGRKGSFYYQMIETIFKEEGISLDIPYSKLPQEIKKIIFDGSDKEYTYNFESEHSSYKFKKKFKGLDKWLSEKYNESTSDKVKLELEEFMKIEECGVCHGDRLAPYPRNAKIQDMKIMDFCKLPLDEAYRFISELKLEGSKKIIAEKLIKEIKGRLKFLLDVGLNYLTLNRGASTLSGGESQRIRLATQIGSMLSGVIYVLDEPSIGLHQRDNEKLIGTLKELKNLGNTVIVVEHDEDTMFASDHVIDIGEGAGIHGGKIIATGTVDDIIKSRSLTGKYLSGELEIVPKTKRKLGDKAIFLRGVTKNNLNKLDVKIPLGGLVCVTGVSGSGKSTLIHEGLIPAVKNYLRKDSVSNTCYHSVSGVNHIDQLIGLDQSPIGRTPKSNPATYTKLFDELRALYASTNEAKVRGYKQGRFSFNVKGGRCETCEGNGVLKIEMNFLPDVFVKCQDCQGTRYNKETLGVTYRGKNIAEALDMSVEEALSFFENHSKIKRTLEALMSVGLGYMKLGQSSTTLSGGEAQRLKLSRELAKSTKDHCLYVLDEPTTGLHFQDIKILLDAFYALIEKGHTVLVIEHNLDVIKCADHIIDLGPEGGNAGGQIIAEGTPEELMKNSSSHTGVYLKKHVVHNEKKRLKK